MFASLTLNTDGYEQGLDEASEKTSSFSSKLRSGLAAAGKAVAGVTTAAVSMGAAFVAQAGNVAEYGDNIDKMSQKMGLSATAYQEWDAILQHSGTSIDTLQSGMKTLANAVESGNEAFERLGITQEQIASMDNEQLFSATISALQNVENETERTYLAGQLLGRGATELGALLNTSAEETEAMRQRVHELGGVMSDDAVKNAASFMDSLQDLKTTISGLSRGIVSDMLPSVTTVMDGLTELFAGDSDKGVAMIAEGVAGIADGITQAIPQIIEVGGSILTELAGVIIANLPVIVSAGTEVLLMLVQGILTQLPQLISSAGQIVTTFISQLAAAAPQLLSSGIQVLSEIVNGIINGIPDMVSKLPQVIDGILDFITENLPAVLAMGTELLVNLSLGIIQAIPTMVSQLPQIISSFVDFVVENLPTILSTGVELLGQLIAGIISAIPDLVAVIPGLISAIVDGFANLMGSIISIGSDIVNGIKQGISDAWGSLTGWVGEKFSGLVNGVKSRLQIASPSKVFAEIGGFMAEGVAVGWNSEFGAVKDQIEGSMEFEAATVGVSVADKQTQAINGLAGAMLANGGMGGTYEIILRVGDTDLAEVLFDPLKGVIAQRGESFA